MPDTFPRLVHVPDLPWCYYDRSRDRVVLRLLAQDPVESPRLLYGDPYDYGKRDGAEFWERAELPLEKQFSGPAGEALWRVEFAPPRWKRLMYGFIVKSAGVEWYWSPGGFLPLEERHMSHYYHHFFYPYIHAVDAPLAPAWAPETVWYQIFPDRFHNGDPALSPRDTEDWDTGEPGHRSFFGGDLRGVRRKLGYLKDLGVTGIYFCPVFQAPSNHKYDTEDYYSVDRHLGTLDDLRGIVEEAHRLGMKVMLDAVFNHAGRTHPWWQDVLEKQEKSAYRDCFHIRSFPVLERYPNPRDRTFDTFSHGLAMPKWNTENSRVREHLIGAALYWIRECNIDAWRLDVANEVSFDFWREFSARVHAAKQDFYLAGEIWYDAAKWVRPGLFDAAMNYPLGFAVASYLLEKKIGAEEFSSRLLAALARYGDIHNRMALNLLDSHDTERALHRASGDRLALRSAFIMLMFLPGSPCVYYGTEAGMTGGGDPQNRRPMIWDESRRDAELFAFFQALLAARRQWLAPIQNGSIAARTPPEGSGIEGLWTLAHGGAAVTLLRAGERPLPLAALEKEHGRLVIAAGRTALDELPAAALAAFARPGLAP